MENQPVYKVWEVFETLKNKEGYTSFVFKYYVVNTQNRKVQSCWDKPSDAGVVCRDLNAFIRRQTFIDDSRKSKK